MQSKMKNNFIRTGVHDVHMHVLYKYIYKNLSIYIYIRVFPKIMVPPNHPFVHRVFHEIFTIHFGGKSLPPLFLVQHLYLYTRKVLGYTQPKKSPIGTNSSIESSLCVTVQDVVLADSKGFGQRHQCPLAEPQGSSYYPQDFKRYVLICMCPFKGND